MKQSEIRSTKIIYTLVTIVLSGIVLMVYKYGYFTGLYTLCLIAFIALFLCLPLGKEVITSTPLFNMYVQYVKYFSLFADFACCFDIVFFRQTTFDWICKIGYSVAVLMILANLKHDLK